MQISSERGRVVAVLGATNTGKTHFAMERMLAHDSGMIGFPLRLLARENYDHAVKIKGENQVALITGEEKITPKGARYFLCTTEAMPTTRPVSFLGLDEVQMCADPDRGHIFTERLLAARGTSLAVVTNDLVTKEDAERLQRGGLIAPERVVGVEAGACPHTVIREDPTLNIEAADLLEAKFTPLELIIIESGGDNLASTFSLDLVDYWIFVIDVAGGDDIPRKKGPGIVQADLLIINKIDLAPHVGVNVAEMAADAEMVRGGKPVILANCRDGEGLDDIVARLAHDLLMQE